jgi:Ca2+-binding RTX toxin-like protein
MKSYHKAIFAFLIVSLLLTGIIVNPLSGRNPFVGKQDITANAQTTTPFVTIAVEQYTQNHLPNITGTCRVGDNLVFTIKKGNTGVVSETINKACTVSPYALTPTIVLPDGKYRVDVTVGVAPSCNVINGAFNSGGSEAGGTTETITGTPGDDCINGNGGEDTIYGGTGNDIIYAGSPSNPIGGIATLFGDGGNDIINGGGANISDIATSTGVNFINGTNGTLLGISEHDTLIGGGDGSFNYFYLTNDCGEPTFYVGNGDNDFATIINYDPNVDVIQLGGLPSNYVATFSSGVTSIYKITGATAQDLVARVNSTSLLDLNGSGFFDGCGNN